MKASAALLPWAIAFGPTPARAAEGEQQTVVWVNELPGASIDLYWENPRFDVGHPDRRKFEASIPPGGGGGWLAVESYPGHEFSYDLNGVRHYVSPISVEEADVGSRAKCVATAESNGFHCFVERHDTTVTWVNDLPTASIDLYWEDHGRGEGHPDRRRFAASVPPGGGVHVSETYLGHEFSYDLDGMRHYVTPAPAGQNLRLRVRCRVAADTGGFQCSDEQYLGGEEL